MDLQVIETKRGKPSVLYSGYRFTVKRVFKNTNILWTCATRTCRGTITTCKDYTFLETKSCHTCVPDIARNEVRLCLYRAKKRAREEHIPIPQIYRQELMSAKDAGLDFVAEIPDFSSVKDGLYRERHRALGVSSLPKKREDIAIPVSMQPFVLADDGYEDRIIIFASGGGQLLTQSNEIFMDGTFKSCCSLFDQLYTIHVDLASDANTTCVVPAIYALLPNRKEVTYRRFFILLRERISTFNPKKVHIDFEQAAINALQDVFPEIIIKGCNFHFNQAIWRKVQELGLVTYYKERKEVRDHIRMCAALAHLPEEHISDGWLHIMENAPNLEALDKFNDYFVEQWLENVWIWVCYNERHRTTNSVEGWHNRLNKRVGKVHPNIFELMIVLLEEIHYYDVIQQRCDIYLSTPKRSRKFSDLDDRLNKTVSDYLQDKMSIQDTLHKLIYIVKLD